MVYSKPECQSVINNLEIKPGNVIVQDGASFVVKSINPIRSRKVPSAYEIGLFCTNMTTSKIANIIYSEDVIPLGL